MNLVLDTVQIRRGTWSISAQGIFEEGIHLVSGEVGSGKSMLALALAGLLSADSGKVIPRGISTRMVSFQFPEYHLTGLSVEEECRSWGLDPDGILPRVNLEGKRLLSPLALSRGELKCLHLACILSRPYDLLILDEPFSSLDCQRKERVSRKLSQTSGITIIFSHEQAVFPKVDFLWEIRKDALVFLEKPPLALEKWQLAPEIMKKLIAAGKIPRNISKDDLLEAACRT